MEVEQILSSVKDLAKLNLSSSAELFLFGSHAKGLNHSTSDIDLAVSNCTEEEFTRFETALLSIPTLRKIDLVNLQKVSKTFKDDIMLTAKKL